MLIGFTLSIVLFILVHPQRTYKVPRVYAVDDLGNKDELTQLTKILSQKTEPNVGTMENIGEKDHETINEEGQEMTGEERNKIDKEFKEEGEEGEEERKENTESKCK